MIIWILAVAVLGDAAWAFECKVTHAGNERESLRFDGYYGNYSGQVALTPRRTLKARVYYEGELPRFTLEIIERRGGGYSPSWEDSIASVNVSGYAVPQTIYLPVIANSTGRRELVIVACNAKDEYIDRSIPFPNYNCWVENGFGEQKFRIINKENDRERYHSGTFFSPVSGNATSTIYAVSKEALVRVQVGVKNSQVNGFMVVRGSPTLLSVQIEQQFFLNEDPQNAEFNIAKTRCRLQMEESPPF